MRVDPMTAAEYVEHINPICQHWFAWNLESLESYEKLLAQAGLEVLEFEDLGPHVLPMAHQLIRQPGTLRCAPPTSSPQSTGNSPQCGAHYVMTAVKDNRPELLRDLAELAIARADGRYPKLLASIAKTEVLVIDDWGLAKLNAENRRDLLEIIEDRHGIRSTVATSQLPLEKWHDVVGDPTLADAILDRLVHSAYQLNLKGESMRKRRPALTQTNHRGS